jgi:hypothetical protein
MPSKTKPLAVIDDPAVKELYANKVVSVAYDGGGVTLTLGVRRMVPDKIENKEGPAHDAQVYITSRLTVSPHCALEIAANLAKVIETLKNNAAVQSASKVTN